MDCRTLLQRAFGLHQQGQLDQAALAYEQILQQEPVNFAALQMLGALRAQQGQPAEALFLLEAALKLQPQNFGALANYGQILMGQGRQNEALAAFDQALALKPDFFEALYNKGTALSQLNRFADAVSSFDQALTLRPGHANCLYNRGIALAGFNRLDDALESYDSALAANPRMAEALDNRGNVLRQRGRLNEALESYDRALALAPRDFRMLYNRGVALADLGRDSDALASYDQALAFQPQFADALFNRGQSLLRLKQFDQAQESFDQALAINPGHSGSLLNRAFLLQEMGEPLQALASYDLALAGDPGNARAWNGRGAVLQALKRDAEALDNFSKALALDPALPEALANRAQLRWTQNGDLAGAIADLEAALASDPNQPFVPGELLHLKMYGADWQDFDALRTRLDDDVHQSKRVVRPFVYQAISDSPADLQECSRIFAAGLFPPFPAPPLFRRNPGRIRIGYVSAEFREQATAHLMAGVYELHDRGKFEVIAIDSGGGDKSPMRRRLEAAFDKIIPIAGMSDEEAVARIRADEIDILVNLNGYFGAPRMGLFARRAAPIQVNYLGFPATLGASYMDYIIADRVVIPEGEQSYYDEQVVWLPHSYQANDRKRAIADEAPSRMELGLPGDDFVFCNFNQSYKITPSTFAGWMRILGAVENSVLWLLASKPPFEENLRREAQRHGIAPSRLIFAPSIPPDRHLARLGRADLFLDSLPYNAHTTASDALWAGLPLLTYRGDAFPGRVAASLLTALDLPELITETTTEYESLAVRLAKDAGLLAGLKQKLAHNRLTAPLFDTGLFCRDLEAAYAGMVAILQRGEPPKGFAVGPARARP
jgi:predicted O-linked N-acetylglucosamine transferase (SPINDLY family)